MASMSNVVKNNKLSMQLRQREHSLQYHPLFGLVNEMAFSVGDSIACNVDKVRGNKPVLKASVSEGNSKVLFREVDIKGSV